MKLGKKAPASAEAKGPVEAGSHIAVCTGVIDLGLQENTWQGETKIKPMLLIQWEIDGETITIDGEEKNRVISKRYTFSMNQKATLYKHLKAWISNVGPDTELTDLLGKGAMLSIVHSAPNAEGRVFANVDGVSKLPKGMKAPRATSALVAYDVEDHDDEVFNKLPQWVKDTIMKAKNFMADDEDVKAAEAAASDDIEF